MNSFGVVLAPIAFGISITRRDTQETCGDFCLLLPELCLDTAHSQKTKIPTFFLALTPLITKFRERWGLVPRPVSFFKKRNNY
jgi:hypothetical protein